MLEKACHTLTLSIHTIQSLPLLLFGILLNDVTLSVCLTVLKYDNIFLAQTLYLVFLLTRHNLSHIHKLQIPKKDTPCHSTYIPLFGLTPL